MFRKALKTIAPYVVGSLVGLLFVILAWGKQVAAKAVIPVVVGILVGFAAALYFAKKEKSGK